MMAAGQGWIGSSGSGLNKSALLLTLINYQLMTLLGKLL